MPTYSYQPCTDIRVGAIIYEKTEDGDVAVLTTAHKDGMENDDHNDMAEDICSMLTLLCVGPEQEGKISIAGYARELERREIQTVGKEKQAC